MGILDVTGNELEMTHTIEHVRPGASAAGAKVALFDFDGTISVIRAGWVDVMAPMMIEILLDLKTDRKSVV